jgi:hypothetical protein
VFILPFPLMLGSTFQLPLSHTRLPSTGLDIKNSSEPPKSDYSICSSEPSACFVDFVGIFRDPSDPVRPDRHVSPLISPYDGRRSVGVVMEPR